MSKIIEFNGKKNEMREEDKITKDIKKEDIDNFLDFIEKKFDDKIFSTIFAMGFSAAFGFLAGDVNELKESLSEDIENLNDTIEDIIEEMDDFEG